MESINYTSPDGGYSEKGPAEAPVLAGDDKDDDGLIVDSLVELKQDAPETLFELDGSVDGQDFYNPVLDGKPFDAYENPRATTRILTGTFPLSSGGRPIMILPRDEFRKTLFFRTEGDVRIADELTVCYGAGIWTPAQQMVSVEHTGALWVLPVTQDASKKFHYWSVTR